MSNLLKNTIRAITIATSLVLPLSISQASENIKNWTQRICKPEEAQSGIIVKLQPGERLELKVFRESGNLYSEENHSKIEGECGGINIIPSKIGIKSGTIGVKIMDTNGKILDLQMLEFEIPSLENNQI